jgi:phosphate-selective porin OprO/OprP
MSRLPQLTLSALILGLAGSAAAQQGLGETFAEILERQTGKKLSPEDRQKLIDAAHREAQQVPLRQTSNDELDAELSALRAALAAEPEGGAKISTGPGKGITILSGDENFSLNLGAQIQIQASYTDLDNNRVGHGAPPIPPFPAGTTYGGNQDTSNWAVRRARILMQGHAFDPKFTYKLQFEASNGGQVDQTAPDNNVGLLDAWVNYEFDPVLNVAAGQMKSPFGLQQNHLSWRLQTVERSQASNFFAPPPRQIGGMIWGLFGEPDAPVIEYAVGAFNGEGVGVANDEPGQQFVAAVRLEPFGEEDRKKLAPTWMQSEGDPMHLEDPYLMIGGGGSYDSDDTNAQTSGRGVDLSRANIEGQFKMMGFSLQGEYFWEWWNPEDGTTRLNKGYYGQLGYFILPSEFEVYGRYDHIDISRTALSSQYYGANPTYEIDEYTLGFGYFFSPDNPHAWKIQAEYVYRQSEALGATLDFDDQIFRAMLTFVL